MESQNKILSDKNSAIKDGFDEMEGDDSKSTPGPGAYLFNSTVS